MARILIVEDSTFLSKPLKEILEDEGHEVVGIAENGFEGIAGYRRHKPDLTLLDITMPGMGGRACLDEILTHDPSARVVMVSAVKSRTAIIDCLTAGARGYVEKPLRFNDPDFREEFLGSLDEALSDE